MSFFCSTCYFTGNVENERAVEATGGAGTSRTQTGKTWTMGDLDLNNQPPLKLREDPISFDGQVQYGGRTPKQELEHLEVGEAAAYAKALKEKGLDPSTTDYPQVTTIDEAAGVLAKIEDYTVKLYDGVTGKMVPAMSKGFEGTSEFHVASLPGSDTQVYNDTVLCCLEEKVSFGVVFENNWDNLWFAVWKLRQREAHRASKHFLVLTKEDGSVGFNQSLEVAFLRREGIPFEHMSARSFLLQLRPMIQAAWYRDYESVKKLLGSPGAAELLRQREDSGLHTLHVLAQRGKVELVRQALVAGAVLEAPTFLGCTPLYLAAESGQKEVARLLLEAGANVEAAQCDGATPLFVASEKGQLEVLGLLLQAGANVEAANRKGFTPLIIASECGQLEVVGQLLQAGANVEVELHSGFTALLMASQEGHQAVVGRLLEARGDVNHCAKNKVSPLIVASEKGHLASAKALLKARADTSHRDSFGDTALDSAMKNRHKDLKALLEGFSSS